MLPASQTSNPPGQGNQATANRWVIALVAGVVLYTLAVGIGLLANSISPESAYLLMALLCLFPMVWYGYGFIKVADAEQDFGLLLSAIGWLLAALAFVIKHRAALRAAEDAASGIVTSDDPAGVTVCMGLAAVAIMAGAFLSWHAWVKEIKNRG
ncbi:MAG TPA: hypothetical protein VNA16_08760 [Abditibacteriaceae bacterium]|nr:hypothetical protein [Abditibacteriaceae bacterium]